MNLPSALDSFSAQINAQELREERERRERREERKARQKRLEEIRLSNILTQRRLTVNAAIRNLASAAEKLSAFYPVTDAEFPALIGLRPVLKKLLDDITPPELPPIECKPDDDEEDALRACE